MRFVLALVSAMAATVMATPYQYRPKPPSYDATTTGTTKEIVVTYTSPCPITSTVTKGGETLTLTYTETSTVTTHVITTIEEAVELPDVTTFEQEVDYTTYTSTCPVTETKVIGGETLTITYSTVSTITEHVPTTIVETSEMPDVTETVSVVDYEVVTEYYTTMHTTVVEGETITTAETLSSYITTLVPTTLVETSGGPDITQ
jgi:hypothetical protein